VSRFPTSRGFGRSRKTPRSGFHTPQAASLYASSLILAWATGWVGHARIRNTPKVPIKAAITPNSVK
jgi:hypothetical protein